VLFLFSCSSAFFFFCNEFRAEIKKANPSYGVGDIAKELGKRWETCPDKDKYEGLASRDKERYERDITAYKAGGGGASLGASAASKKPAAAKGSWSLSDQAQAALNKGLCKGARDRQRVAFVTAVGSFSPPPFRLCSRSAPCLQLI